MKKNNWHQRHAIMLAGQLPEKREDALLIIEAMTRLVLLPGFWEADDVEQKPALSVVVPIRGDECA